MCVKYFCEFIHNRPLDIFEQLILCTIQYGTPLVHQCALYTTVCRWMQGHNIIIPKLTHSGESNQQWHQLLIQCTFCKCWCDWYHALNSKAVHPFIMSTVLVQLLIIYIHLGLQWCLLYWLIEDGQLSPSKVPYQEHQNWSACATQPFRNVWWTKNATA